MQHFKIIVCAILWFGLSLAVSQAQNVTDIDGNVYKTVTIGAQTWMVENLKTTKLTDGSSIPLVADNTAWLNQATPALCWYNNDEKANKKIYGSLYNWHTVNTGKICPTGWHVPTDDEWKTMIAYLGGAEAGNKLQEKGTTHWLNPNESATNASGFTALPGGLRVKNGTFAALGLSSYWWCSTEDKPEARYVGYYDSGVERGSNDKQFGLSVRCVMGLSKPATPDAMLSDSTPEIIAQKHETHVKSDDQKQQEMVTIRNEDLHFEVSVPKSWSFGKIVQPDPYEEMKSGTYGSSIFVGEGEKEPENWNGFRLISTDTSNNPQPFVIIYGHKVSDQNPEEFATFFKRTLSRFSGEELSADWAFSVGNAKGFDCTYGLGAKVRYTALYRDGIRVVIMYYFPSSDPTDFVKYAPEVEKVIRSLRFG